MKILTKWLRAYLPELPDDDSKLAEDLTLRGIAVEGIYDLGPGNGSLYEMDITTNRARGCSDLWPCVACIALSAPGIPPVRPGLSGAY